MRFNKKRVKEYIDTIDGQLQESLYGEYITKAEFDYMQKNIYELTKKCWKQLKEDMTLEEELKMINKNIIATKEELSMGEIQQTELER